MALKRQINIRGINISEIQDKNRQIKERLIRSAEKKISDSKFVETSYSDAIMMLVETDITLAHRAMGETQLRNYHPNFFEIMWTYFAGYTMPGFTEEFSQDGRKLFATMANATANLVEIPRAQLLRDFTAEDTVSYCGVEAQFERVRDIEGGFKDVLNISKVQNYDSLFRASLTLACVAIDGYNVNYLNGWTDTLAYGPTRFVLQTYFERHPKLLDVFETEHQESYEGPVVEEYLPADNFTINADDEDTLRNGGWRDEGINRFLP